MLLSESKKLEPRLGGYVSIGITQDGAPRGSVGVPWVTTAHAFNMRTPDVYIAPEDLQNGALMALLDSCKVIGCYIWVPMADYGFLTRFRDLQDLTIYNGDSIRNLDFLRALPECRMLFLENAVLSDLNAIVEIKKERPGIFSSLRCVGLYNCRVTDLSAFEGEDITFSEFLVWYPKGSDDHRRWQVIDARILRYYELKG